MVGETCYASAGITEEDAKKHQISVISSSVIGDIDTGEMINILGVIIEMRMSVFDLLNLQVATHPLLTTAPTTYPIIQAAQNIAAHHISVE